MSTAAPATPEPTSTVEAIVRSVPSEPIAVRTPRALVLKQALEEEREQRLLLSVYVRDFMKEGEDYGTIPGTPKPSLWKPGAEKLLDLFRCRPEYEILAKEVNHETGLFYYEIRCRAVNRETDTVLNEGVGSASSYESKYRYRNAGRVCPNCKKDAIIKGRPEFGGGWVCYAKKGGCGAKWSDGAAEIEGQDVGKIQNPDLADVANTILKMAKKRAQVDCAIALARVSDIFTQDLEDLPEPPAAPPPRAPPAAQPTAPRRQASSAPPPDEKAPEHVAPLANKDKIAAMWKRAVSEFGELAADSWEAATIQALGENILSKHWTPEQAAQVEAELFREARP